ncbi:MAG: hypothetical protein NC099_04025 [Corallococcus sp.]|nr:hypothetical protein [Bacillota bacterium]MCM1533803.1 hypothetical protein [Corallococcus sp.]
MRKLTYLSDIAVVVGCAVGVGFLSGKEAQIFFGNVTNVAIFAVTFALINVIFREYCRKRNCGNVAKLSVCCFKRYAIAFDLCISACCFVCVVTMLAGVEQCISNILPVSAFPLYALVTAVIATAVMQRGLSALKTANFISIALAVTLIVILYLTGNGKETTVTNDVPAYNPIAYALFTFVMSFGVTTTLGSQSGKRRNVICSLISAAVIALMMIAVMGLSDFSLSMPVIDGITDPFLLALAVITLILSAVTGIVANAMPIVSEINALINDRTLSAAAVFTLALSMSMFGFDFALKYGYMLVGVVGAITLAVTVCRQIKTVKKSVRSVNVPQ